MSQQDPADARAASIRHMREAAAARVESTSLRQVAREVGMSPTGLKKFLVGAAPYSPTVRRLRSWYVRHAASPAAGVQLEDASAAVAVLTHDLTAEPRRTTAVSVIDAVGTGYEQSGLEMPAWVFELRTMYAAGQTP